MKAQSPVFEQVMLFSVSIAIFILCFSMFKIYESYFTDILITDQLNGVRDFIVSNILILSKSGFADSSIALEMPKSIVNQPYEVSLSDRGINITAVAERISVESGLYNLNESFRFSGSIKSSYGGHMIYKKGNKIIIE